ncbi:trigger factor [Sphaerotilus hippei]|uniref:Trigger factor n=1 Tax=Sphaerotilus hippei TaxID=744406 RepID=A0A318H2P1_9BURK|nr:trigger factor [Sphaerotilus hippei]PXW95039.1 trigger factor [Sphaerotilus hippei]
MAVTVETLDKLERRITLALSADEIKKEVESRLKDMARKVKIDGFRPGKVPMNVVAQRYGYSVQYEVMNDKVGQAFAQAAGEARVRVAGTPSITEKEGAPEGQVFFDATFEVYPEVTLGELSALEVERVTSEVTEAAIDRTVDILRKQRRTFVERAQDDAAVDTDRVTIDFEGKIDGEPFEGGKATGFQFILGEGRMLEAFEKAVRDMKTGESKTFPLKFPDDYHGADVAGKEADFLVTLTKTEAQQLPEVDVAFAESLGIPDATVEGLRADIKKNLEREVKFRIAARNKQSVMAAIEKAASFDLPKALVSNEMDRLVENARADLKQRGIKDADKAPIPTEMFLPQAERRVRLGLAVAELVRANNLAATADQVKAHIDEMAQSYERPQDVMQWYMGDQQRLAEVEAVVIEANVTEFVLGQAQVSDKSLAFDELMGA